MARRPSRSRGFNVQSHEAASAPFGSGPFMFVKPHSSSSRDDSLCLPCLFHFIHVGIVAAGLYSSTACISAASCSLSMNRIGLHKQVHRKVSSQRSRTPTCTIPISCSCSSSSLLHVAEVQGIVMLQQALCLLRLIYSSRALFSNQCQFPEGTSGGCTPSLQGTRYWDWAGFDWSVMSACRAGLSLGELFFIHYSAQQERPHRCTFISSTPMVTTCTASWDF